MTVSQKDPNRLARRLWSLAHRASKGQLTPIEQDTLHAYLNHYQATIRNANKETNQ